MVSVVTIELQTRDATGVSEQDIVGSLTSGRNHSVIKNDITGHRKTLDKRAARTVGLNTHIKLIKNNVVSKVLRAILILGIDSVAMTPVRSLPSVVVDQAPINLGILRRGPEPET